MGPGPDALLQPARPARRGSFAKAGAWITVAVATAELCGVEEVYELSSNGKSPKWAKCAFVPDEQVVLKYQPASGLLSIDGSCEYQG